MSWQPANDPKPGDKLACDAIDIVIVPRARDLGSFTVRRALPSKQRQCPHYGRNGQRDSRSRLSLVATRPKADIGASDACLPDRMSEGRREALARHVGQLLCQHAAQPAAPGKPPLTLDDLPIYGVRPKHEYNGLTR
jgi:hypothetical protein